MPGASAADSSRSQGCPGKPERGGHAELGGARVQGTQGTERIAERGTTVSDHKAEDMKGRLKEAAGDITGDKDLQQEGKMDQASAATKKTIDDAADKVKDFIDPNK
jgi:uncharacterized protein YjbJ (UPF0337 family)